jgi:hypothetical protein
VKCECVSHVEHNTFQKRWNVEVVNNAKALNALLAYWITVLPTCWVPHPSLCALLFPLMCLRSACHWRLCHVITDTAPQLKPVVTFVWWTMCLTDSLPGIWLAASLIQTSHFCAIINHFSSCYNQRDLCLYWFGSLQLWSRRKSRTLLPSVLAVIIQTLHELIHMPALCLHSWRWLRRLAANVLMLNRRITYSLLWWMSSSGMLHRVALVRTDASEELMTSIIRVTRIGELGTTLAITSSRCMLRSYKSHTV